jgi:hypothetical protein
MAQFLGGSAFAMASQTADGYMTLTPVILKRFQRGELSQLQFELQKILTTLRGNQPTPDDTTALQAYHHKLGRIRSALLVIQNQLSMKK